MGLRFKFGDEASRVFPRLERIEEPAKLEIISKAIWVMDSLAENEKTDGLKFSYPPSQGGPGGLIPPFLRGARGVISPPFLPSSRRFGTMPAHAFTLKRTMLLYTSR